MLAIAYVFFPHMGMTWISHLLLAAILMLPYLITRRAWVQWVVLFIVACILEANLLYFRNYFAPIPVHSYLLVGNLSQFTASVTSSVSLVDAPFLIILIGGVWLSARVRRPNFHVAWVLWGMITTVVGAIMVCYIWALGGFSIAYGTDGTMQTQHIKLAQNRTAPLRFTLAGHIAYQTLQNLEAHSPERIAFAQNWLTDHKRLMPAVALPDSVPPRQNLVLVILESFETWPLQLIIDHQEVTPHLNRMLNDSLTFFAPKVLSQADCGRSIDGQLLVTTGLMPAQRVVFALECPNSTYPSLPKAFKQLRNAKSAILTVDLPSVWNSQAANTAFGYDSIMTLAQILNPTTDMSQFVILHEPDAKVFATSQRLLAEGTVWPAGGGMFTAISISGHSPFVLPEEERDPKFDLSGVNLSQIIEDYLITAHYTDKQLAKFIAYLQTRSDWKNTMVVITSDHEGLATARETAIKHSALEAQIVDHEQFVPLIVLNAPMGGRYNEVMGQVDIYPTLLTMLGLHNYEWEGIGQSIFAPDKIPAAISLTTGKLLGDTTGIAPKRLQHWLNARKASDAIIRANLLKKQ